MVPSRISAGRRAMARGVCRVGRKGLGAAAHSGTSVVRHRTEGGERHARSGSESAAADTLTHPAHTNNVTRKQAGVWQHAIDYARPELPAPSLDESPVWVIASFLPPVAAKFGPSLTKSRLDMDHDSPTSNGGGSRGKRGQAPSRTTPGSLMMHLWSDILQQKGVSLLCETSAPRLQIQKIFIAVSHPHLFTFVHAPALPAPHPVGPALWILRSTPCPGAGPSSHGSAPDNI